MKTMMKLLFVPALAAALLAQGPPPGGRGGFGGGRGGFGPRGLLGAGPGSRTPVTGEPYSGTETVQRQQLLANGNQITTSSQTTVYRDTQGRIRTDETITPPASSGKSAFTMTTIFDPVAGYEYVLNSSTMTYRQRQLPPAPTTTTTRPARPAPPNVATTSLGTQVVNGVSATGTQRIETIPAGAIGNAQAIQVVRTTWVSTDLNVPVSIKTSDPRFGSTDMELTNIVEAEPTVSFGVPSGYTLQTGGGRGGPRGAGRRGPGPR